MNHHGSISEPRPASRVDEAMSAVSGNITDLLDTIATLRVRMGTALIPEAVTGDQAIGSEKCRPPSAPLVENLDILTDRIRNGNLQLQDLLSRLAI